jgi:hypothetical protein
MNETCHMQFGAVVCGSSSIAIGIIIYAVVCAIVIWIKTRG